MENGEKFLEESFALARIISNWKSSTNIFVKLKLRSMKKGH